MGLGRGGRAAFGAVVVVAFVAACTNESQQSATSPRPSMATESAADLIPDEPSPWGAATAEGSGAGEPASPVACTAVLPTAEVQGLLGGPVRVEGGVPRVTGGVTSTRCDWRASNDRYLTVIALSGPRLATRVPAVSAGSTPVAGRPGVRYHPDRGLIVEVSDRVYQVVAGGAGTAQARVVGLKAIDGIRAAAA